jgi:hypothetical protein
MFRALLVHPQEVLHKRHLVYCVLLMSVGCGTVAVSLQPCHSQLILYTRNIANAVIAIHRMPLLIAYKWAVPQPNDITNAASAEPPEDEKVMFETWRGPWFSINVMKSASCWFHYTDQVFIIQILPNFLLKQFLAPHNKFTVLWRRTEHSDSILWFGVRDVRAVLVG